MTAIEDRHSTAVAIAEREADEAERETEAAEAAKAEGATPEPETTTEPERQPVPPSSVTEAEKRDRALKSEDGRHEKALMKVYGDDFANRVRCSICDGEGYFEPGPEIVATIIDIAEQARAQYGDAATGLESPDNYVRCEYCAGRGTVGTKARTETTAAIPCKKCQARGYFDTDDPVHRGQLGLAPPAPVIEAPTFPVFHVAQPPAQDNGFSGPPGGWHAAGKPGADQWDRWPGHPRYGIDPDTSPTGW